MTPPHTHTHKGNHVLPCPRAQEEERKERELLEMSLAEYRKTLAFKARVLPDFSAPFQPAASPLSPTKPEAFALKTTSRLGDARPLSAREDYQASRRGQLHA